jgi:cation transport ATPase
MIVAETSRSLRARTTVAVIRGALLIILVIGLVGLLAELLLLEHVEDSWQRLPIFLIMASLIVLGWHAVERGRPSLRALQATMILLVLAGSLGLLLHFKGNIAFEQEMQPPLTGWALVWAALKGATPTLAPGAMVQLGLIGLAYTYRHPRLGAADGTEASRLDR